MGFKHKKKKKFHPKIKFLDKKTKSRVPKKLKGKVSKATKRKVLVRDNYTCQCCFNRTRDPNLEVHHIILKSRGGSHEPHNLITICRTCHTILHMCLSAIFKDLDKLENIYLKKNTRSNLP